MLDDVDTRHRPPEASDDGQQRDDSEKRRCHTTCNQLRVARLRPYPGSLCVAHDIGDLCCAQATALIGAERVGDKLSLGRASTSGWESRDVKEHALAAFERRDKAKPAKIVPFSDFALGSHVG